MRPQTSRRLYGRGAIRNLGPGGRRLVKHRAMRDQRRNDLTAVDEQLDDVDVVRVEPSLTAQERHDFIQHFPVRGHYGLGEFVRNRRNRNACLAA